MIKREPGSSWENGFCESFNSKLQDELLNLEVFSSLREAEVLIRSWRQHFNTVRPHSSLGYVPPAPEAPTVRLGDVVILDDLSSHKGPRVEDMIQAAGARLRLLPPYSPDFIPIEQVLAGQLPPAVLAA